MRLVFSSLCLFLSQFGVSGENTQEFWKENSSRSQSGFHRVLSRSPNGSPSIIVGDLGKVDVPITEDNEAEIGEAAIDTLDSLSKSSAFGEETQKNPPIYKVGRTNFKDDGSAQVRVLSMVEGMVVEGAALTINILSGGTIGGVNGQIVDTSGISTKKKMPAQEALDKALEEINLSALNFPHEVVNGKWLGEPELAMVRTSEGNACRAWKATYSYDIKEKNELPRGVEYEKEEALKLLKSTTRGDKTKKGSLKHFEDTVFAESSEGILCARHPVIHGEAWGSSSKTIVGDVSKPTRTRGLRSEESTKSNVSNQMSPFTDQKKKHDLEAIDPTPSLRTFDCSNMNTAGCSLVSSSSEKISTGDLPVDSAHNFAIDTWQFYYNQYGRDSLDGNGLTLTSLVHFGFRYNNAFWSTWFQQMTYGDGDGTSFLPFSLDADVVAHELTHGVTDSLSSLIYQDESGAINEALSDIFGAMVDWESTPGNTTVRDRFVWLIGEDIYIPDEALRSMDDPAELGSYDFYPTSYTGPFDNGGVHFNSGIANLAFSLMVKGGSHPREKTSVVVPQIGDSDEDALYNAARIFYNANANCLTPSSTFLELRYCTAVVNGVVDGVDYAESIHLAWDAVGVPYDDTPPLPMFPIGLEDSVPVTDQELMTLQEQEYILPVEVRSGETKQVKCVTEGDNGDAVLFARFNSSPVFSSKSSSNACFSQTSGSSNEECTTSLLEEGTYNLHVLLFGNFFVTNLTLTCYVEDYISPPPMVPIVIDNFVPNFDQSAPKDYEQIYALPFEIPEGMLARAICVASGPNGDADLYLNLDSYPEVGGADNECSSSTSYSFEVCGTSELSAGSYTLFALVHAYYAYSDLTVFCLIDQYEIPPPPQPPLDPIDIEDGVPLSDQEGLEDSEQEYHLLVSFPEGEKSQVRCTTEGDGDADLYLNIDGVNECASESFTSDEECVTSLREGEYTLVALVYGWTDYGNLTITCDIVPMTPIDLIDGVSLSGQSVEHNGFEQEYHLALDVPPGQKQQVRCQIEGNTGNADLSLRFDQSTDYLFCYHQILSYELCGTKSAKPEGSYTLVALVRGVAAYADLTITCDAISMTPIVLGNGVPETDQNADLRDVVHEYHLPFYVPSGERRQVRCRTEGSNGDADLYVSLDETPDPSNSFDCVSGSPTSNEVCTLNSVPEGTYTAIALVHAWSPYKDLTVTCEFVPTIVLEDGKTLTDQVGAYMLFEQEYQLPLTVRKDEYKQIRCMTEGDGDADLFLRFDNYPNVNDFENIDNECFSAQWYTSNEECTTSGKTKGSYTLSALVQTWAPYNNLAVTCYIEDSPCKKMNKSCSAGAECCSGTCHEKFGQRVCGRTWA